MPISFIDTFISLLIYRYSYADILELLFQGFDVAALICLYSWVSMPVSFG